MTQLPTVSVIIPTRRRQAMVDRLVRLLLLDEAATEVIVAVDGQEIGDRALDRWRQLDSRVTAMHVRASPETSHGGWARDQVVHRARGDVILALDDDVVPWHGLASGHARRHEGSDRLLVLGYMPVAAVDGSDLPGTARFYSENYERSCRRFEDDPATVLTGLWGGNYSLRRKDWLASMDLPRVAAGYHADREFGLRLRVLGLRGSFDRALRADHIYRRTPREFEADARSAGLGTARLGAAHPELCLWHGATGRLQSAIMRSRGGPRGGPAVIRSLAAAARAAHLARVEQTAIQALWQLEFARGYGSVESGESAAAG